MMRNAEIYLKGNEIVMIRHPEFNFGINTDDWNWLTFANLNIADDQITIDFNPGKVTFDKLEHRVEIKCDIQLQPVKAT